MILYISYILVIIIINPKIWNLKNHNLNHNLEYKYSRTEGENSMDTEGEGEPLNPNEIELVFKPHPTEMTGDNQLMRALRDSSVRYLKTTANASGKRISFYFGHVSMSIFFI